jgi:hypothetical protein
MGSALDTEITRTHGRLDDGAWYHGSPEGLTVLAVGSTITRCRAVAEAFSHKPTCVGIGDETPEISVCHNGRLYGHLYLVEDVAEADVRPHPESSFPSGGLEWLTNRPLRLRKIADLRIDEPPCQGDACSHRSR